LQAIIITATTAVVAAVAIALAAAIAATIALATALTVIAVHCALVPCTLRIPLLADCCVHLRPVHPSFG
jgi:hypothetical protein